MNIGELPHMFSKLSYRFSVGSKASKPRLFQYYIILEVTVVCPPQTLSSVIRLVFPTLNNKPHPKDRLKVRIFVDKEIPNNDCY